MKRPQGFDRTNRPHVGRPARGVQEATTEPIRIIGDAAADTGREARRPWWKAPASRMGSPVGEDSPGNVTAQDEPARDESIRDESARDESAQSDPAPEKPSSEKPAPLTPAAARRNLRAARRARKSYERQEVRRFTWRSRRRTRNYLIAGGIGAALIGFVLVGAYSPLMALRTIEVTGTSRIPVEQVQSALSGNLGTPLPLIDSTRVKDDLSQLTLIQSFATESRPPGTLVVRIVERQPVGAIGTEAGFDLVDAAGVVIQATPDRPEGYPVIAAGAGPGSAGFRSAAAVVAALPESIRIQLDTVTAGTKDDVRLTLTSGANVVWGSPERSDYKAVVLAALLVGNPPGSVDEYDVTSPDSAVVR